MRYLVMLLMASTALGAEMPKPAPTCNQVLRACGQVVNDQKELISQLNEANANLSLAYTTEKELLAQEKEPNLLKNPLFWIGVGIVGGVVLKGAVTK